MASLLHAAHTSGRALLNSLAGRLLIAAVTLGVTFRSQPRRVPSQLAKFG
jgi:hypothetical protein